MKRKALLLIIPFAAAGLAGCQQANPNPPTPQCDPSGATINKTELTIHVTDVYEGLVANAPSGCTFSWSSNNEAVATVDANGVVTGVSEGTAVIKYADASGQGVSCTVTVVKQGEHIHTFSDEWSYDAENHWHAATCEHTDQKSELGEHIDEDEDEICDICELDLSKPVAEELSPEQVIDLCDEAGEGKVVNKEVIVVGVVAENSEFNSKYKEWKGKFEGSSLTFDGVKTEESYDTLDGKTVKIKGYPELYNGTYKVGYLPANISPTGEKYSPTLVSVTDPVQKEVSEVVSVASSPEKVTVNSTVSPSSVKLNVKYTDGSTGVVSATKVDCDTSKEADSVEATAWYNQVGSAKFNIKVVAQGQAVYGTEDNPISVSQAIATMSIDCPEDTNLTKQAMYCIGTVKQIKNVYHYQDDIGSDCYELVLTDGTNDVIVYRLHSTDDLKDQVAEGNEIKICGYGKNFKGTLEFVDNGATKCILLDNGTPTPQKEVTGITAASYTKTLYVGGTINPADVTLTVTYSDDTSGSVKAQSVDGYSTEEAGNTTATAHYGTFTKDFVVEVKAKPAPSEDSSVYTFKNDKTSSQNMKDWNSEEFMKHVEVDGSEVITGMKENKNAYIGGNGGSGDSSWNLWNCLKVGKSNEGGYVTLTLDSSIAFESIKVSAIGARDDGTLTINGVTKNVTKKATKNDLEPMELEFEVEGGISELKISSKEASSNNYGICITQIEFVGGGTPVEPAVEKVELNKSTLNLQPNGSEKLTATVKVVGGAAQTVNWSSDNEDVATVDDDGTVHAVAVGNANITATSTVDSGKYASCVVSVTAAPVVVLDHIEAAGYTATATVGSSYVYDGKIVAYYSNDTHQDVTTGFVVSQNISTASAGTQTGKITYEGKECSFTVVVSAPAPSGEITVTDTYSLTLSSLGIADVNPAAYSTGTKNGISYTDVGNYNKPQMQLKDKSGVVANTLPFSKEITGITVKISKSASQDAKLDLCFGSTSSLGQTITLGKDTDYPLNVESAEYKLTPEAGSKYFSIASANKACYVEEVVFEFGEVVPPTPKVLESISIEGTLTTTSYGVGDTYSTEGLSVVAHYEDTTTETVAATISFDKATAELGDTTITASATYEGKTATKDCTVTVSSTPTPKEETVYYTNNCPQVAANSKYDTEFEKEVNDVTWKSYANMATAGSWRYGGKSMDSAQDKTNKTGKIGSAISKIVINHSGLSNAGLTINSIKVIVSSNADFSSVVDTSTVTGLTFEKSVAGSITLKPTTTYGSNAWAKDCYYNIVFNLQNSSGSNISLLVTSFEFYTFK